MRCVPFIPGLGACFLLSLSGCVEGGGADMDFGSGASASATATATATDDSGMDSGDDGGTGTGPGTTGGDDDTSAGGSDTGVDPPQSCDFALGCHMPGAPDPSVGLASHAPSGCEGTAFKKTLTMNVSSYADPEAPRTIPLLGDLDDDGSPDLVLNFRKASVGFVFRGLGNGNFDENPAVLSGGLFAGGWGGDLGDVNGDGRLDIVLGDHTRSARVFSNQGGMAFAASNTGLPDNVWFNGAGTADLDGDGNLDAIFGADQFSSGYQVFKGDGAGGWTTMAGPASGPSNAGYFAFNDYDGDGDIDIFSFARGNTGSIDAFVFRNDGGAFAQVAQLAGGGQALSSANPVQGSIGDLNCDGQIDVAAGGSIYLSDGSGWNLAADVDEAHISHLADMNGDGHLDLVTQDPSVGLAVYENDGTGAGWTRDEAAGLPDQEYTPSGFVFDTAYGIDVADLDGNGNLDIVRVGGFGNSFWVEAWTR
jgi:hypothetical protein